MTLPPLQKRLLATGTCLAWFSLTALSVGQTPRAVPALEPADPAAVMQSMGYAMATQLRLNIGFTEAELDALFEGMRQFAEGAETPEDFTALVQQAQGLYRERIQKFNAEEEARRALTAAANRKEAEAFFATLEENDAITKTESGLYYEITEVGTEPKLSIGDRATVKYRGTLLDGKEFDSSESEELTLATQGGIIPGLKEGLQMVGQGGVIKLYIPADLAYGDNPRPGGAIEAGDALIFEVEVLEVTEGVAPPAFAPPSTPPNRQPPGPPPSGPPPGPPPSLPANMPTPPSPPPANP